MRLSVRLNWDMRQNVIVGTDIILITIGRSLMTLKLKKKSGSCGKNKPPKKKL